MIPFLLSRCDRFVSFSFLRRFFLAPFLFNNRNGTSFLLVHSIWFVDSTINCMRACVLLLDCTEAMCPLILFKTCERKKGDCEFWIPIRRMSQTVPRDCINIFIQFITVNRKWRAKMWIAHCMRVFEWSVWYCADQCLTFAVRWHI